MKENTNTMLAAALNIAKHYPVFPCKPDSKAPYTPNGFKDATKDPAIIKRMWRQHQDALIGVPTGAASGLLVLDLDRKPNGHDGVATWNGWVAEHGAPETRVHQTPSTGEHWPFNYREFTQGIPIKNIPLDKLAPGIEVKAEGGYVIFPPSRMTDGREYIIVQQGGIADAPPWLQDKIDHYIFTKMLEQDAGKGIVFDEIYDKPQEKQPEPIEKIEFALDAYPSDDYDPWFETGCALYDEMKEAGYPYWEKFSQKSKKFNKNECREKWEECKKVSGYHINTVYGYADRADPTWRDKARQEQTKPGPPDDEGHREGKPEQKSKIHATPYVYKDPKSIPRRQWLYKPSYIRQFSSMLVATSKVGKSSLLVGETLSMVSHKALLGVMPAAPLRVWYWNGEDPQEEIERHFAAAISHYKLTPADIGDRLFVDSGRVMPIIIAEMGKYGTEIAIPTVKGVIETLRANKIDALVIDPFVSSHRVGENDNVAIERVAKMWTYIAEVTNCAIRYAHHSRKTGGEPVTGESQRGASANYAAVRCADTLNYMTQQEAEDAGINPHRRKFYFRQDDESNLLPPADDTKWYEKVSVDLCNAPTPEDSDKVGVVVPWHYPTAQEINATLIEREAILDAIRPGDQWQ